MFSGWRVLYFDVHTFSEFLIPAQQLLRAFHFSSVNIIQSTEVKIEMQYDAGQYLAMHFRMHQTTLMSSVHYSNRVKTLAPCLVWPATVDHLTSYLFLLDLYHPHQNPLQMHNIIKTIWRSFPVRFPPKTIAKYKLREVVSLHQAFNSECVMVCVDEPSIYGVLRAVD